MMFILMMEFTGFNSASVIRKSLAKSLFLSLSLHAESHILWMACVCECDSWKTAALWQTDTWINSFESRVRWLMMQTDEKMWRSSYKICFIVQTDHQRERDDFFIIERINLNDREEKKSYSHKKRKLFPFYRKAGRVNFFCHSLLSLKFRWSFHVNFTAQQRGFDLSQKHRMDSNRLAILKHQTSRQRMIFVGNWKRNRMRGNKKLALVSWLIG